MELVAGTEMAPRWFLSWKNPLGVGRCPTCRWYAPVHWVSREERGGGRGEGPPPGASGGASSLASRAYTVASSKIGSMEKSERVLTLGVMRKPSSAPACSRPSCAAGSSPPALVACAKEVRAW